MLPDENDIFGGLPDKTKIGILLGISLHDIHALTMASPAMVRYFRDHEISIPKPHLDYVMDHQGNRNAIPLVMITTRLRHLRDRLEGQPASEVEERIAPMVESIRFRQSGKHQFKRTLYAQDPSLSVLATARSLIPELIEVSEIGN